MSRKLIIIGGGLLQVPLIETALSMGLEAIVFDMSSTAPGIKLVKHSVLMSTRDVEGCVREARKLSCSYSIHGVITAGTDASRTVAAIASALNLTGIRYADAEACTNKVIMRKRLRTHKVPVPLSHSVWSLKEAREAMDELAFPLVLKPAENMGSRGVIKVRNREEMHVALKHTKKYSPTGEMLVEEYMPGPELSVDALIWQGKFRICGIADRIISGDPFFIELGHNMPSRQPKKIITEATEVMYNAAKALGIHTGAAKGDLKITPEGIKVGEIAARLSGGFMSSHTYPLHCGVNLLKAAIHISLGEDPELHKALDESEPKFTAIERSILSTSGKISRLSGLEKMRSLAHIKQVYLTRQEGDLMTSVTNNADKIGHIIAQGKDLEEAERAIKRALEHLQLEVDESQGVDWQQVKQRARTLFSDQVCWVCKNCDGKNCASGVPGMGGVGSMNTFRDNSQALGELQILPRYIRKHIEVDTSLELFGHKFEYPVMAAPMTGAVSNMNGAIDEYEFSHILLSACRESGTIAWVGDGASPLKYLTIMEALQATDGFGIAIFKPRADLNALKKRFQAAERLGLSAVGMDIDAISFPTMLLKKQPSLARDSESLQAIRELTSLPFVLKGIMTPDDAYAALAAGADAIVVSNHGGRILDDMPGTARVLPAIVEAINARIPVLVDGGIRSGYDVFKMLALGADAVLVGRPLAIAAVGGAKPAVKYILSHYADELKKTMHLCGTPHLQDISAEHLQEIQPSKRQSHRHDKDSILKHQSLGESKG